MIHSSNCRAGLKRRNQHLIILILNTATLSWLCLGKKTFLSPKHYQNYLYGIMNNNRHDNCQQISRKRSDLTFIFKKGNLLYACFKNIYHSVSSVVSTTWYCSQISQKATETGCTRGLTEVQPRPPNAEACYLTLESGIASWGTRMSDRWIYKEQPLRIRRIQGRRVWTK